MCMMVVYITEKNLKGGINTSTLNHIASFHGKTAMCHFQTGAPEQGSPASPWDGLDFLNPNVMIVIIMEKGCLWVCLLVSDFNPFRDPCQVSSLLTQSEVDTVCSKYF